MKHSCLLLLAAASLLLVATAQSATRPSYGGTLRIEVTGSIASLDPARGDLFSADTSLRDRIAPLLFDTLVKLDESGRPRPALAISWSADQDFRRWRFVLRPRVRSHDGSRLVPRLVVASISAANPAWRVHLLGDDLVIESDGPMPDLLSVLACPRYSVVARAADAALIGTGPFRVADFQVGKHLLLRANEEYWGGRPFLDAVDVTMARSYRDQALDLQLDRADVIEIPADQVRRATQEGQRLVMSSPVELLAILCSPRMSDARMREALSASIDRASIHSVLLQRQGEPAGSLLPQWLSGYAFLYPISRNEERLRQLRAGLSPISLSVAYDWSDPVGRSIAERVVVNARDAGINLSVFGENLSARQPNAEMRIVRIALPSTDSSVALADTASALGRNDLAQQIAAAKSPDVLFNAESTLIHDYVLIPLVYLPEVHALGGRVRNWSVPRQGGWSLDDVSLALEKP